MKIMHRDDITKAVALFYSSINKDPDPTIARKQIRNVGSDYIFRGTKKGITNDENGKCPRKS